MLILNMTGNNGPERLKAYPGQNIFRDRSPIDTSFKRPKTDNYSSLEIFEAFTDETDADSPAITDKKSLQINHGRALPTEKAKNHHELSKFQSYQDFNSCLNDANNHPQKNFASLYDNTIASFINKVLVPFSSCY